MASEAYHEDETRFSHHRRHEVIRNAMTVETVLVRPNNAMGKPDGGSRGCGRQHLTRRKSRENVTLRRTNGTEDLRVAAEITRGD